MKTFILLAITTVITFALTGCGTIRGVGQDVSTAGRGVSNAATTVQQAL